MTNTWPEAKKKSEKSTGQANICQNFQKKLAPEGTQQTEFFFRVHMGSISMYLVVFFTKIAPDDPPNNILSPRNINIP